MKESRKLRTGFTTGTCAAAAAGAAVMRLCTGQTPLYTETATPAGKTAVLEIEAVTGDSDGAVSCGVRKDSGDDPDVTNGTLVCARASYFDSYFDEEVQTKQPEGISGKKEIAAADPEKRLFYESEDYPGLCITGGVGIGLVTKKGLSCPVGYPAINPVPREMIFCEADRARKQAGREDSRIRIEIFIPDGEALAEKTFNSGLGIVDGLSILGTTGIVNPMSEAALIETIRLDIRVRAAEGRTILAVAPGNYGERFLREETELSMDSFVKCSNFIGDTFRMLAEEGVKKALLAGHPGKLVKVAGGILNTHSRYGDRRMEILSDCARKAGADEETAQAILHMNTTDEAAAFLAERGVLQAVMTEVSYRIKKTLEDLSGVETEVMLFSGIHGFLASTAGAESFADALRS